MVQTSELWEIRGTVRCWNLANMSSSPVFSPSPRALLWGQLAVPPTTQCPLLLRSCNPRMGVLSPSATFKAKVVLSLTPGNKAVSKTEQDQALPSVLGATPAVPKADSQLIAQWTVLGVGLKLGLLYAAPGLFSEPRCFYSRDFWG